MRQIMHQETWKPDRLAYWYFRLNGFLTTENFVVHPDRGADQGTDADLLAVRFAHRAENLERVMRDDPIIASCSALANVVIAEVKRGLCDLNGPWVKPDKKNMKRVLKALGCVPESAIESACDTLREGDIWADAFAQIRVVAVGERTNPALRAQQLTWDMVMDFCIDRFEDYQREKSSLDQWPNDGKRLRALAIGRDRAGIRQAFGLNPPAKD